MDYSYFLYWVWNLLIKHGIPLAALLVLALLVPRAGRLTIRIISRKLEAGEESTKASLALVGALVYVLQAIAYFAIIMIALTNLGVPAMGAALPATVVSAAIGFGAQSVISDFLSGFFIISERQFGMGDFVSFDGTANPVEGTVVALTLRATKIRTPSGEVVTVPNGSSGVITNYSQEWSRAVVDMQIPLRSGESMKQLTEEVETATRKALADKSVRRDITGELEILPAVSVLAPTTAGQPWSVTTRIVVQVNPARQWAVERVIRAALLNTFWDRYEQTADLLSSSSDNSLHEQSDCEELVHAEEVPADNTTDGLDNVANNGGDNEGPGEPSYSEEDRAAAEQRPEEKVQEALSVGGRVRSSTTMLLIALAVLGFLALLSANPEGGDAGLLNPERYRSATSASNEKTTDEPTPTETTEPTPENTKTAEPTSQQSEEQSTQPSSTADNTAPTQQNNSPTNTQTPSATANNQPNQGSQNDPIATEPATTD